jgi:hypothetical protein
VDQRVGGRHRAELLPMVTVSGRTYGDAENQEIDEIE